MPLVGPSSSMVEPTLAGSSREWSKRHMPAYYEAISYILAIHSKHGNAVMGWQPRSNKFLVCVDDVLTQTLCYSHSCLTWKFVEVLLPGSRCSAANRTFSASVSGLNVAEDGGICRMNVGIWGSGVQVPPDVNEQYSIVQGSRVPRVDSSRGFKSFNSNLTKGSSSSSRFKPRVEVPQVQFNQGLESLLIVGLWQFLTGQKGSMEPGVFLRDNGWPSYCHTNVEDPVGGRRDDRQLCNGPATGVATVSPNGGVTRAWPGARRDAGSSLGLVSLGKSWSCRRCA